MKIIAIPLAAILPRKGEHLVFVAQNGRALRRRVQIDALIGHEAVLSEGLNPGERLIVEGHRGLQDGLPVEVVEPAEPREP